MRFPSTAATWLVYSAVAVLGCYSAKGGSNQGDSSQGDSTQDETRQLDPCLAAIEQQKTCWASALSAESQEGQAYLQACRGDEDAECGAACLADATCDDYIVRAETGCFPPEVDWCLDDCGVPHNDCSTPLVLSLSGERVRFTPSEVPFDFGGAMSVLTDWPSAETPWLAFDRNGNGSIDDGGELFGSGWRLRGGGLARNGFDALRELDSNQDGHITPEDDAWSQIWIWGDRDADRRSSADELSRLSESGIVAIDLAYGIEPRCDLRGNCEVERAFVHSLDPHEDLRSGSVIDVHLRHFSR